MRYRMIGAWFLRGFATGVMKLLTVCAVLAGLLSGWAGTTLAAAPPASGHPTSLEQAVKQVQHETRGHILATDTFSRGRTQVYRIKVLRPNGRVQVIQLHSPPHPPPRASKSGTARGGH